MLYGIEPAQNFIPYFFLAGDDFGEDHFVAIAFAEGGTFLQSGVKIMILQHLIMGKNNNLSRSITFRTFQNHVPNKIAQCDDWI